MPQNFEEKYPNNGMNRDDESRYLKINDSRFILNTRAGSSEDNSVGAIENIKGTTEVEFDMPSGRNVCIGSKGDQTTNSAFFFLWNSNGGHTIYRYFTDTRTVRILVRDSLLNFSETDLINDINVVQDLLFWRDIKNPPRKINFKKADNDNPEARQVFHWYLGDEYLKGETSLQLDVESTSLRYLPPQLTGSFTFTLNPLITSKTEIAKDLSSQINNLNNVGLKGESCGEFVVITVTVPGYVSIVALKNGSKTAQVVPQNHYSGYVERTIDVIKHPVHCELTASVKSDENKNRNYISEKVFQFASRIIYDDDEKSTVNPHSLHIYNQFPCPQFTGNNLNNYIEIDISVIPEINNIEDLQTIKRLELYFREGELGLWKSMKVLEQYEFVDTSNQHFDFYNDENYTVVDQTDFVRPFDLVPQRTKNMEIVKNRQFFANNLEGYDNVCVDSDIVVDYDDIESRVDPPTYTINGRIDIRAAFNSNKSLGGKSAIREHQPIWKDNIDDDNGPEGNPTVFGGLTQNLGPDQTLDSIAEKTGQILPLGGFTVYLAGTDYYDVSKQKMGYTGLSDVSQDPDGVFVGSGSSYVDHVREYVFETDNYGELFSTFQIEGVPDGWYILRVASHQTTQAELDSGSRGYQDTSTNAFNFENQSIINSGVYDYAEQIRGRNELLIHVNGGNVGGVTLDIMDLSHANNLGSSKIMSGYVVDSDISTPISTFGEAVLDTRISRAKVVFDKTAHAPGHFNTLFGNTISPVFINDKAKEYWLHGQGSSSGKFEIESIDATITDHNGFFFFASIIPQFNSPPNSFQSDGELSIESIQPADAPSSSGLYNGVLYSQQGDISNVKENNFSVIASRTSPGASFNNRTKVEGNVKDLSSIPILGASIVSSRTPVSETDSNGDYQFWHYGILEGAVSTGGQITTDFMQTVVMPVNSGGSCSSVYDDQIYPFGFNYSLYYPNFSGINNAITTSPTLIIDVPDFEGDSSSMKTLSAFKRGGDWKFGIVYYDRGLRSGAVNTIEDLKIHIPFYSEKDSDGMIKNGVPVLSWSIKHRPPSWATHWQWVRTKNTTIGSYMQWAAGRAYYQDADGNPASFQSGSRLILDISNLTIYAKQNPGTDLQFGIDTETTRVRFIKNHDGIRYVDYFDFPVLAWDGVNITLEKTFELGEIQDGVLIEIYNEILDEDTETQVYYEFGECFEVKEDDNKIKYHGGESSDQNPLMPSSSPATGTFSSGDAYYRLRGIPQGEGNSLSYIDDDAVSDFYKSEVESLGRPNGEDPDAGQIWKPNQIRHSLRYIPDSKINGFSTFYALNFTTLPIEFGDINKLQLATNVLMSIHEFRWVSNYIEEAIVRKQGGADDLVASTDVFGSFRAANNIISGTVNQESVVEYKGDIYAYDKNKGLVNRWGSDGLTTISDYKMSDYFSDKSKEIINIEKENNSYTNIIGVFDSKFNEYILSFGNIMSNDGVVFERTPDRIGVDVDNSTTIEIASDNTLYSTKSNKDSGSIIIFDELTSPTAKSIQVDNRSDSTGTLKVKIRQSDNSVVDVVKLIPGQGIQDFNLETRLYKTKLKSDDAQDPVGSSELLFKGETISFSEKINKWITFYSFKPEMFGIINLEMISFLDGRLWIHNDSEVRNNFYGVQYTSQVETVFNSLPEKVKVFQSVGAESYHPWSIPSAKTPNGRETEVVAGRFVRREDSFFAPLMRDKNDPSFIGKLPEEAIINGRQLRDRSITVLFENGETEEVVLYSLSMLGTLSSRHQK